MLYISDFNILRLILSDCSCQWDFIHFSQSLRYNLIRNVKEDETSKELVAQAMAGAAKIILDGDSHPGEEILKVCTPGGLTIKGVKALEDGGFSSAVIAAMVAAKG